jgi:uric acid transporter
VAAVALNLVFNHLGRGADAQDVTHPMEAVSAQPIS